MNRRGILLIGVALFSFCSTVKANITNASAWAGNAGITLQNWQWYGNDASVIYSNNITQTGNPGILSGAIITTDTSDPTLTIASSVNNDTSFAWTEYLVNVYMNTPFTLSGVAVTSSPFSDWTVTTPLGGGSISATHTGAQWYANIVLDPGTPLAINDSLDFQYSISFSSSTHYSFTQEMIPVPEPSTVALVAIGGVMAAGLRLRKRSR